MYENRIRGASVCVVDMTHGGTDLCIALVRRGAAPVAVDVHSTLSERDVAMLRSLDVPIYGSYFAYAAECRPDLVVMQYAPDREAILRHCADTGIPVMTHSRFTGLLIRGRLSETRTAEITGARGKSTVMGLLTAVMAHTDEPSLFMTSMGAYLQEGDSQTIIDPHGSITPAHALSIIDLADDAGMSYSHCFFEISLGGLGVGDVCTVLGVPLELKAGVGRSAFFSKAQMAELMPRDSIINLCATDPASFGMRFLTAARFNAIGNVDGASLSATPAKWYPSSDSLTLSLSDFSAIGGCTASRSLTLKPSHRMFGSMAVDNILAAAGIALALGVPDTALLDGVASYRPLPRRMEHTMGPDGVHRISNNATSKETALIALDEAIAYAQKEGTGLCAVLGGRTKTSCGTMDLRGLADGINARLCNFVSFMLFGELGSDLAGAGCKAPVMPAYDDAERVISTQKGRVIVSCIN
jgi:UDP-N-acetylmuramoylalanine-D-glutamate ligase